MALSGNNGRGWGLCRLITNRESAKRSRNKRDTDLEYVEQLVRASSPSPLSLSPFPPPLFPPPSCTPTSFLYLLPSFWRHPLVSCVAPLAVHRVPLPITSAWHSAAHVPSSHTRPVQALFLASNTSTSWACRSIRPQTSPSSTCVPSCGGVLNAHFPPGVFFGGGRGCA